MAIDNNPKQAKRFQNLTVNYGKIVDKLSMNDRLEMLRNSEGRQLLSSLTPYQLAEMFPDYYKERLPDVGRLLKSISDPSFKPFTREEADIFMETERGRLRVNEAPHRFEQPKPKWQREFEKETGVKISDPGAKARLSEEQKAVLDELSKGKISSDDPRVSFLKDLSDEDLQKGGIKKEVSNDGKIEFSALPTTASLMTDEELRKEAGKGVRAGTEGLQGRTAMQKSVYDSFIAAGFSDKQARALTAEVGRENNFDPKYVFGSHAEPGGSANVRGRTNTGMFSWGDPARRKEFLAFMKAEGFVDDNGNLVASPEALAAQARFVRKEMQNYEAGRKFLENPDISRDDGGQLLSRYIGWDISGRYIDARKHIERRNRYYADIDQINKAFPNLPANPTAEQLDEARRLLEQREKLGRQSAIAGKIVPKLPEGLDPRLARELERKSPAVKQDVISMIETAGGGRDPEQVARGVKRLNDLYQQDPKAVQRGVFQGNGKLLFSDQSVANRAGQLNPYMQGALNKFQEFAPQGTTVTSTFRGTDHPIESEKSRRGRSPGAHTRGAAIDVRTEGKSREELQQTIQALKRAGFTKILLEGNPPHIHAEVNPGQSFHVTNLGRGNPHIDLKSANEAASVVAFNEELEGQQKKREKPTDIATADVEPAPTPQPEIVKEQTTTTQAAPQEPQANAEVVQAQTEEIPPEPVKVLAEGGSANVQSDMIKAMPIDSLKGDNSVVLDQQNNPLFTMNTKEEQALYNPKTRQVDVQPLTKTNPNMLGEKQSVNNVLDDNQNVTLKQNQPVVVQQPQLPSNEPRSGDVSVNITDDIFKDPSFKRAIAKTRFVDTGDAPLGGHFGLAQADLA